MAYIILFILLFCILYSPELFLIAFGLFVAGWIGYTMGKENKNAQREIEIKPLDIDPDELKTSTERCYEKEVESAFKPEYRIRHIINREKKRLNKIANIYKRSLNKKLGRR